MVFAYHPGSDSGPLKDDDPMTNRTTVDGGSTAEEEANFAALRELFTGGPGTCEWQSWTLRDALQHLAVGRSAHQGRERGTRPAPIPTGDGDPSHYYAYLADAVLPFAADVASPRCLAHMATIVPGFVHDLMHVLLALNPNLVKRDASHSFTVLERETLAMMHGLVFDRPDAFYRQHEQNAASSLGLFCSGGALANLSALWIARNSRLGCASDGVQSLGMAPALHRAGRGAATIVGSSLMHYSLRKAAGLLGLGENNLRTVAVDHRGCADVTDSRRVLRECAENGDTVTTSSASLELRTTAASIRWTSWPIWPPSSMCRSMLMPRGVARSCSRQSSAGGLPESSGPTR